MGLFSGIGAWMSGTDLGAQEEALAAMEEKLAAARALEDEGMPPAEAAAAAGFGKGAAQGGGSAGDTSANVGIFKATINGLANWGALAGSALGITGTGDPDPGSMADTVGDALGKWKGILKWAVPVAAVGIIGYFIYKARK